MSGQTAEGTSAPTEEKVKLGLQFSRGAGWFYWIGALSLVNTLISYGGGELNFVVGLGITQFIGAIGQGIALESPEVGDAAIFITFGISLVIAAFFALFGVLCKKRFGWAFIVGMVFYVLDALLFVWVGDVLSIGFHLFALANIYGGFSALRKLKAMERMEQMEQEQGTPAYVVL